MIIMTQAERITALEVTVAELKDMVQDQSSKLDDLLALRNKGAGVFWLFSTLVGSGMLGLVITLIQWFKG